MIFDIEPIGVVHSTRRQVVDGGWAAERASIHLDPSQFSDEALLGLEDFSHVEILFLMDRVQAAKIERAARHPRNDERLPCVGIFAQRGKNRPNRLGLTFCRVLGIWGTRLDVAGLDAVDGTPIVDIKPWYVAYGPHGPVHQPAWVDMVMAGYW